MWLCKTCMNQFSSSGKNFFEIRWILKKYSKMKRQLFWFIFIYKCKISNTALGVRKEWYGKMAQLPNIVLKNYLWSYNNRELVLPQLTTKVGTKKLLKLLYVLSSENHLSKKVKHHMMEIKTE